MDQDKNHVESMERDSPISEELHEDGGKPTVTINNEFEDCSQDDQTNLSSVSEYDISSSSLIKSPLVSELLTSHGLLKNGCFESGMLNDTDSVTKLCSLSVAHDPPTFLRVYSLNSTAGWDGVLQDQNDDDEKGDYRCGWKSCDMYFNCRKDLAQHVNSSHIYQDKSSLYRCHWNGCSRQGKAINARYRMLIHIRTHTHEKPHGCEICGKSFSRLENLRIHIRSHTGEKPYVCPVEGCNKAYSNSSDRFKHSRTHQEDKPYVCRVEGCGKRYTDPSSLRKHMKSTAHGREQNGEKYKLMSPHIFSSPSENTGGGNLYLPSVKNTSAQISCSTLEPTKGINADCLKTQRTEKHKDKKLSSILGLEDLKPLDLSVNCTTDDEEMVCKPFESQGSPSVS